MLHHSIHGTLDLPPASEPVRDPILSGNLSLEDMPVPVDEHESVYDYDYDGPVSDEPPVLALEGNIEDESPRTIYINTGRATTGLPGVYNPVR